MQNPRVFTLLGRAGSGKGTQAKLLVEKFGFIYIGGGEMLRELAEKDSFSGKKISQSLKTGELSPTTLVFQLWINKLEEIKNSENENFKGIVFDGNPRMLEEARLLDEALDWYEWGKNTKALLIDISRQEAFDRLTKRRICKNCHRPIPFIGKYKELTRCDECGGELEVRTDDNPEAINLRLDLYDEEVVPVVNFYEQKEKLIKINGEQSIKDVHEEILKKIKA